MTVHKVSVTFNPNHSNPLTVDPPNVDLQEGDQVFWQFNELPPGCVGGIHFEQPLGPFSSIQLVDRRQFLGVGNVGLPQGAASVPFRYRAQVLTASQPLAVSSEPLPTITNLPQPQDTSPQIIVQIDSSTRQPTAQQQNLSLNIGDTATWHIFGLPADHFVTLFFPGHPDEPLLGPFRAAFWTRAVTGDDMNEIRGSASGFGLRLNQPLATGAQITYNIQVRSADGAVVGSDDPVIDNLGEPVPTGG